jgi:hypothetical protein
MARHLKEVHGKHYIQIKYVKNDLTKSSQPIVIPHSFLLKKKSDDPDLFYNLTDPDRWSYEKTDRH